MVLYELKKAAGQRLLIVFALICIILNIIIAYAFTERDDIYFYLDTVDNYYSSDPEAVAEYYNQLSIYNENFEKLYVAYMHGELIEEPILDYPCTYSGKEEYNDFVLLNKFFSIPKSNAAFLSDIQSIIDNAKINKLELLSSYKNIDEDSYAYKKQDLIERTYTDVRDNTELKPQMGYGWDQFFGFDAVNVFIVLLIIAGASAIFLSELGNAALILRATKRGRGETALAKLGALSLWSIFIVLVFLFSTWLAVLLKCGAYSDILNSIAVFDQYKYMPYHFTVLEYFWVYTGVKLILFCAIAMLASLLCMVIKNISFSFLASLSVVAVSYLIYLTAKTEALKYLNFAGAACLGSILTTFRCFNFAGAAVTFLPFIIIIVGILFIICGTAAFVIFSRARLSVGSQIQLINKARSVFSRLRMKLPNMKLRKKNMRLANGGGLLYYEFRKSYANRAFVILVIIAVILKIYIAIDTYSQKNSYQMMLYANYMEILSGPPSEEKTDYIRSEKEKIESVIEVFNDKKTSFFKGELSYNEYSEFLKEYSYSSDRIELIKKIDEHTNYLNNVKASTGIDADYIYELDWIRLFDAGADIILIALVVFIASGVFSDEYGKSFSRDGILNIIRTTKSGRRRLFYIKTAFIIASTIAIVIIFTGIDILLIFKNYNLPDSTAPLLSLKMFSNTSVDISIRSFYVISFNIKTFTIIMISVIVTMAGILIKNKLFTLIAAFSIVFIPNILNKLGLAWFRFIDICNAVDFPSLYMISTNIQSRGDISYALIFIFTLTIISISMIFIAGKEYCK